jgi:hypothetical protein
MQIHAVPQDITGFEYRLIGNLTLRQFAYVGIAGVIDFVLYSLHVPLLILLIIGLPISLFALALAFLPVNDLPFERWFVSLLKTFYSPSIRVWHREPKSIGFLEPQFSIYLRRQEAVSEPRIISDRSKLNRYLEMHRPKKNKSLVDINEERRLAQLALLLPTTRPSFASNQIATSKLSETSEQVQKIMEQANTNTSQSLPRFKRMAEVAVNRLKNTSGVS